MDIRIRQRIIGLIVLIALPVIFVPLLFTGSGRMPVLTRVSFKIPTPPSKPQVDFTTSDKIPLSGEGSEVRKATTKVAPSPAKDQVKTSITQPSQVPQKQAAQKQIAQKQVAHKQVQQKPVQHKQAQKKQAQKKQSKQASTVAAQQRHRRVRTYTHVHKQLVKVPAPAQAWTIQLASFGNQANAAKMVKQLRAKGFTAYLKRDTKLKNGKPLTRVFVGPELVRAKADKAAAALDKTMGLKALVVKYKVGPD